MHIGLDILLFSIKSYPDFIEEINKLLTKYFDNSRFVLVYPQIVLTVKWKYDYIISRKKKKNGQSNECICSKIFSKLFEMV